VDKKLPNEVKLGLQVSESDRQRVKQLLKSLGGMGQLIAAQTATQLDDKISRAVSLLGSNDELLDAFFDIFDNRTV
jgi:hypothetical protein